MFLSSFHLYRSLFNQVYLDRGVEDKERYRREMEYWEKQKLQQLKEVMEAELANAKNDEPERME